MKLERRLYRFVNRCRGKARLEALAERLRQADWGLTQYQFRAATLLLTDPRAAARFYMTQTRLKKRQRWLTRLQCQLPPFSGKTVTEVEKP